MDGRPLPTDPNPSFMGYSVGRWEGDTLVVESSGFNDRTWLDFGGHPHTEALRTTERYRRTSFGRVERQVTLVDPGAFNAPITIRADMVLAPDTDLLDNVCNENPRDRDRAHLVGRTAEERRVVVAPELLAKYVGVYELERPAGFGIRTIEITREGDQLWVALNGRGRLPMTPLSDRMFSPRLIGTYEFVMDAQGTVNASRPTLPKRWCGPTSGAERIFRLGLNGPLTPRPHRPEVYDPETPQGKAPSIKTS